MHGVFDGVVYYLLSESDSYLVHSYKVISGYAYKSRM